MAWTLTFLDFFPYLTISSNKFKFVRGYEDGKPPIIHEPPHKKYLFACKDVRVMNIFILFSCDNAKFVLWKNIVKLFLLRQNESLKRKLLFASGLRMRLKIIKRKENLYWEKILGKIFIWCFSWENLFSRKNCVFVHLNCLLLGFLWFCLILGVALGSFQPWC